MKEKLIEAVNAMWGESYTDFKEMCDELSPSEILDAWLSYEGISGYTAAITVAIRVLGWTAPDEKNQTILSNFTQSCSGNRRLSKPIRVGECYHNDTSCYEVREAMPSVGEALLYHPKDDFYVLVRGAALYDTPSGEQLLWSSFTLGDFRCSADSAASKADLEQGGVTL
ncbi:MAG: hypothetical protein RSG59_08255 [Ruthenibacterium sp.]